MSPRRKLRSFAFACTILCLACCTHRAALAQAVTNGPLTPTVQRFRLSVSTNILITCPDIDVSHTHNGTATNQNFPLQVWRVRGNTTKGVTVTYLLASPFQTGAGNADHLRRDARLRIQLIPALSAPNFWTNFLFTQTISTDIANGKMTDTWQSTSFGVADANIRLRMTFVDSLSGQGFGTYAAGEYITTVVGEVTENP